jgi:hypothetical protein
MAVAVLTVGTAEAGREHNSVRGKGVALTNSFEFWAHNTGKPEHDGFREAKGYFRAKGSGLASGLIAAEGPVTCLIVRGNRAGFIYPGQGRQAQLY